LGHRSWFSYVKDSNRSAWEQSYGHVIGNLVGQNATTSALEFAPAKKKPTYLPATHAFPNFLGEGPLNFLGWDWEFALNMTAIFQTCAFYAEGTSKSPDLT